MLASVVLNSEQVDDLTLAQIEKKRKQAYNRLEQRQERVKVCPVMSHAFIPSLFGCAALLCKVCLLWTRPFLK